MFITFVSKTESKTDRQAVLLVSREPIHQKDYGHHPDHGARPELGE
jgi:hypothetical protein